MHPVLAEAVAKKAGVHPNLVLAFKPSQKPLRDRPGLYLRQSAKTGEMCWAYWNGTTWGLYSGSKKGAMRRREKPSKKSLRWFALAKPAARTR